MKIIVAPAVVAVAAAMASATLAQSLFPQSGVSADTAQIERGSQAFIANGCGWCHAAGGRKEGRCPQLMDDAHDDDFLMTRIATGSPGRMPAFGQSLPIEDIQAIIAYIRNLKP